MLVQPSIALNEETRHLAFPVTRNRIFMAHAGVAALPRRAVEKMQEALYSGMVDQQENETVFRGVHETRNIAAKLINAKAAEISLIGPTALGLNLVAQGLSWTAGDEVVYYPDDYPANVYPWQKLAERGVHLVPLKTEKTGQITPELVFSALTSKTRLVALASCHFLSGYRLDYKAIGHELGERGIFFCLDGIQSLGATELDSQYFDFLSADSHKWLLGPLGAGIFFVKESAQTFLKPSLVGSWNIQSPRYIPQAVMKEEEGGRRYECGSLYVHGILGMRASMELLLEVGLDKIEARLIHLHRLAAERFKSSGFTIHSDSYPETALSGIITLTRPNADLANIFERLQRRQISASLRWNREGVPHLRFSPHFYNTEAEIEQVDKILKGD